EAVASEVLLAHREQLTAALQALGFESSEIDIFHQPSAGSEDAAGQSQQSDQQRENPRTPYRSDSQTERRGSSSPRVQEESSGVNLLV
ncbi:MAG: hypothetical protein AAFV88_22580, partial [Planctomycetota bacterium]